MRIKQVYVSSVVGSFRSRINTKYNLSNYSNKNEPSVFFGCYPKNISTILAHNSLAIVVWRGGDGRRLKKTPELYVDILKRKNIKHIAISSFLEEDLAVHNVPFIFLPICHVPLNQFQSVELGNKIYIYNYKRRCSLYGQNIIDKVLSSLPDIEILPTKWGQHPLENMQSIYQQCFIGLRPIKHDGLSNTVIELGLAGRRCIYNGSLPNAIHWKSVDDIVNSIREEYKKVGTKNEMIAKEVLDYITISDDWLYTEFYDRH